MWVAISAAVLALAQPWIFEFSQIGRFYTLTLWFVTIACISLYRWTSERRRKYLYLFIAFGALATFTHTTAFAIFPAGFVAVLAYDINSIRNNLTAKKIHFGIIAVVIGLALVSYPAFLSFSGYLGSNWGKFADYSIGSLVAAFVIFCGVQVWALAFLPMLRWPKQWSATERFWLIMFLAMFVPFICLAPFGGGIAPRFLFATLPCLIVLAAEHWQMVMNKINDKVLSAALGVGLLGVYLPQFVSTYVDGNHHDYRQAARFVESLALDDPMIASTAHGNLQHYLDGEFEIEELGVLQRINVEKTEEESFPRDVILRLIEKAESTRRPLVLVSREDRLPFHPGTRRWIGEHFSIIGIIERPRYDHRRNMLVVYEYRTDGGSD